MYKKINGTKFSFKNIDAAVFLILILFKINGFLFCEKHQQGLHDIENLESGKI